MEQLDVWKIMAQSKINGFFENYEEIRDEISFLIDQSLGNIKYSEVYGDNEMIQMDCMAIQHLSTIIFQDLLYFIVAEDREGMLVYIQKKYSENYEFLNIGPGEKISEYASNISDEIALQIVQNFIDYDERKKISPLRQKSDRAELYRDVGAISQKDFLKIQEELSTSILVC